MVQIQNFTDWDKWHLYRLHTAQLYEHSKNQLMFFNKFRFASNIVDGCLTNLNIYSGEIGQLVKR